LRNLTKTLSNFSLFTFIALVFCSLQSSSWFFLFNQHTSPQTWLPILVYWSLYRRPFESLIMIYILSFTMTSQTATPLGMILTLQISLYYTAYTLKSRLYQPGAVFFMTATGILTLLSPIFHLILSYFLEVNVIDQFYFMDWVLNALLTSLFALPCHLLFVWFDDLTDMVLPTETGRQFG